MTAARKPVEFWVDPTKWEHPIMYGVFILKELKSLGVPGVGALWPQHVESGTLTVEAPDLADGRVRWTWTP